MGDDLKIVVVDDEESILDIFKSYLESVGSYEVFTAKDGLEALRIIKKEKIDCCFTDLCMPHLDGIELTRRIQLYDNTIPVVVMTGYPSVDSAIKTLKHGVVDFLTKPIKMEQILPTIDRVMRERTLFVDNIILKEEARKNQKLLKVNEELQAKIGELETMNLILQRLNDAMSSKDIFNVLVSMAGRITPCDESHFFVSTGDCLEHAMIASYYRDNVKPGISCGHLREDLLRRVSEDGMPYLMQGGNGDGSLMAIPLKIRSSVFGTLVCIIRDSRAQFSDRDLYFLNFLGEKASFAVENMALYENIYENLFSTLYAFVEAIEARDPYTKQHSTRVSRYAMTVAKAVGCSQEDLDRLNIAGNLHDIGKIGIPDKILLKPGRLTETEYEFIKKHPVIGSNIIGHLGMWGDEQEIIRHHHERWDGRGYPDGLKGEEIPFLSRVLSVADVYDALTSDRSYRKKMSEEQAIKIIRENAGSQFDPHIAEAFLELHESGDMQRGIMINFP